MEPTNGRYRIVSYAVEISACGAEYLPSGAAMYRDTLTAARQCAAEQSKVHGCQSDIVDTRTEEYLP